MWGVRRPMSGSGDEVIRPAYRLAERGKEL